MVLARFEIEKFNEKGDFGMWRKMMKAILVQQKCVKTLEGEKDLPVTLSAEEKQDLMEMAYSTIVLNLADNVLRQVNDEDTAAKVWIKLESLYMNKYLSGKIYLKEQLFGFKMDQSKLLEDNLDDFTKLNIELANSDSKEALSDENQAIIILNSLSDSYMLWVHMLGMGVTWSYIFYINPSWGIVKSSHQKMAWDFIECSVRFRSPMSTNMVLWSACEVQTPQSESKTPMSDVMVMGAHARYGCHMVLYFLYKPLLGHCKEQPSENGMGYDFIYILHCYGWDILIQHNGIRISKFKFYSSFTYLKAVIKYGRDSLSLEDVLGALRSREMEMRSKKRASIGEGLNVRGKSETKGQ
ncbi:hypothetical protein EZV62_016144 [Acer yangbiense]|uniref:Retrovirus-related Pol polyprotein from transposon TNT 1-94 n=1 Tax=Acer yangbiense TaxID=1000413 RepID=A0A5C7HNJ4_9ROSI|nr:hypothetical protein EZV62_016144 [Acer yangbiense]